MCCWVVYLGRVAAESCQLPAAESLSFLARAMGVELGVDGTPCSPPYGPPYGSPYGPSIHPTPPEVEVEVQTKGAQKSF